MARVTRPSVTAPMMTGLKMIGIPGVMRVLAVAALVAIGPPTTDPLWLAMRVVSSAFLITWLHMAARATQERVTCSLHGGGGQGQVLHHDEPTGGLS